MIIVMLIMVVVFTILSFVCFRYSSRFGYGRGQGFREGRPTPPSQIEKLSRAGKCGTQSKTVARDTRRVFQEAASRSGIVPELYEFDVPLLRKANQRRQGVVVVKHHMLLPHEYLGHLWTGRKDEFARRF